VRGHLVNLPVCQPAIPSTTDNNSIYVARIDPAPSPSVFPMMENMCKWQVGEMAGRWKIVSTKSHTHQVNKVEIWQSSRLKKTESEWNSTLTKSSTNFLQFFVGDDFGQYSYGYDNPGSSKAEVRTSDGVVRGSYSYLSPDGQVVTNDYVADHNGFRDEIKRHSKSRWSKKLGTKNMQWEQIET